MPNEIDVGLFLIRFTAGVLMAAHGAQKLLGWWGGSSMSRWAADLDGQGIRPGWLWAWISVGGQVAGLLLAAGFLTPLAAAASLIGPMAVVVVQKWPKGFFNVRGGIEFMLTILVIGVAIALTGPGAISVDSALGFAVALPIRLVLAAGALLIGVAVALPAQRAAAPSHPHAPAR